MIIYEMANNHQGSVKIGKKIIDEMSRISIETQTLKESFIKFQFRDLDTFINHEYEHKVDNHCKRFQDTRLNFPEFKQMIEYAREKKLGIIVTPFDEKSVVDCIDLDVDYIKIASCSMSDWPLIERVSESDLPIILSTGGHGIRDIDNIVNYFEHRNNDIRIMHCVSTYPTVAIEMNMNMIDKLKRRYPDIEIGYSGHEAPNELCPVNVAVAKGATMFERHVGVERLNKYSMNPQETEIWVNTLKYAREACGSEDKNITKKEADSIKSLQRGVYTIKEISKGKVLRREDVKFASPIMPGQMSSGEFYKKNAIIVASKNYKENDILFIEDLEEIKNTDSMSREYIHDVKGMIAEAGIDISKIYTADLSHHYGIRSFREYGATIINLINREYCKKLIVLLPGQCHPDHAHKQKEETFHILYGSMDILMEGEAKSVKKGEIVTVLREQSHSFKTDGGVIFEEISTTHIQGDSYYEDKSIMEMTNSERKTRVEKI